MRVTSSSNQDVGERDIVPRLTTKSILRRYCHVLILLHAFERRHTYRNALQLVDNGCHHGKHASVRFLDEAIAGQSYSPICCMPVSTRDYLPIRAPNLSIDRRMVCRWLRICENVLRKRNWRPPSGIV